MSVVKLKVDGMSEARRLYSIEELREFATEQNIPIITATPINKANYIEMCNVLTEKLNQFGEAEVDLLMDGLLKIRIYKFSNNFVALSKVNELVRKYFPTHIKLLEYRVLLNIFYIKVSEEST